MENCTNIVYKCGTCNILDGEMEWVSFIIGMMITILCLHTIACLACCDKRKSKTVVPVIGADNNVRLPENRDLGLNQSNRSYSAETNRLNVNVEERKVGHQFIEIEVGNIESPKNSITRRTVCEASTQTDIITNTKNYTNIILQGSSNINYKFK